MDFSDYILPIHVAIIIRYVRQQDIVFQSVAVGSTTDVCKGHEVSAVQPSDVILEVDSIFFLWKVEITVQTLPCCEE